FLNSRRGRRTSPQGRSCGLKPRETPIRRRDRFVASAFRRKTGGRMKTAAALILLAALAACGGAKSAVNAGGGNGGITIAVIPKGTSHVFWQSIHSGAQKAATDLGVSIVWRGPLREDDRDAQVSEVEGFISRGISGICLAPLDETALVPPVQEA